VTVLVMFLRHPPHIIRASPLLSTPQEDKVDIKALIEFIKVEKEGGDSLNAVRFNIIVEETE